MLVKYLSKKNLKSRLLRNSNFSEKNLYNIKFYNSVCRNRAVACEHFEVCFALLNNLDKLQLNKWI